MSEWYYAEGNRQRQGPLPADDIVELYRAGSIALDTLVWREGLPQWQPLVGFADELGLSQSVPAAQAIDAPPGPPPLPVPVPGTPAPAAPPPRQGLSGCAIAAIVVAGIVGVLLLVALTVLAAVAKPAYQQYQQRIKTVAAVDAMAPLKPEVADFHARQGRCPINGDTGFGRAESYARAALRSVRVGRFDNGHCGLEAILAAPGQDGIDGKALWLDYDPDAEVWTCSSEIPDPLLPRDCRG